NEVAHERPLPWWRHLWHCYTNPFNLLLTLLALISFLTDDLEATVVISTMVVLSSLMRFWQEARSNKAADALKAMVSTTATVLRKLEPEEQVENPSRNGGLSECIRRIELPIRLLVPGDLIHLSAGDMIPADCRLLSAKDLFVG